ncbi:ATP-binding protein [Helicobacter sp. 16-1353]|uniref:ATP-binding protein n=1 Tax=Helicobacter sp. 16-1353 TaxID=2004996 RepID=UPI00215C5B3F|nr:ATP-binding protein [Helicobacter sp. 16-1353]
MKKSLITIMLFALVAINLQAKAKIVQEISGFSHPESVFVYEDNVFVSNVGKKLEPLAKDGDGFISKLSYDGKMINKSFIKNLNAPKGLFIENGKLYVLDIDELKVFDVNSAKALFSIKIDDAVFLNHITKLNDTNILISDTGTGIIHKIDLKDKSYSTFAKMNVGKDGGPNGMVFLDNKLYIAGYDPNGKNAAIFGELDETIIKPANDLKGVFDGLVSDENGNLFLSDWVNGVNGIVYKIDKTGYKKLPLRDLKGPADMFYDGKYLWIPEMVGEKVLKIQL